jgi:hypothetical protein
MIKNYINAMQCYVGHYCGNGNNCNFNGVGYFCCCNTWMARDEGGEVLGEVRSALNELY